MSIGPRQVHQAVRNAAGWSLRQTLPFFPVGQSADILFTLPGRIGDNLLRWPAVYHYHRRTGRQVVVGLDQESFSLLEPLLIAQPAVKAIVRFEHIDLLTGPGGQPWDLGFGQTDYDLWEAVYHLGFRSHPDRNIIKASCEHLPFAVSPSELECSSLILPRRRRRNRVILHGTLPGYKHNRCLYWSFLSQVEAALRQAFAEVLFVGNAEEREYAISHGYQTVATETFRDVADHLNESQAVVAGPSSIAALAGIMQVPCLRVHDNNPHAPPETWANIGPHQINHIPWEVPPVEAIRSFLEAIRDPNR